VPHSSPFDFEITNVKFKNYKSLGSDHVELMQAGGIILLS
jgi:hypothetical protein